MATNQRGIRSDRSYLSLRVTGLVLLCSLSLPACAGRQLENDEPLNAPERLWSPPLDYPTDLMLEGVEGEVLLEAVVDSTGRVERETIRVLAASRPGFQEPAIEMLVQTRFRPASRGNRPIAAFVQVPVKFELASAVIDSTGGRSAMSRGVRLARAGRVPDALTAFGEAQRLDPRLASSTDYWYPLCWYGTIWGYADDVVQACDQLVRLAPNDPGARDARGLARALTQDFPGAIEDFQAVIDLSGDARRARERRQWIAELEAGRNPITPVLLESLRPPST
jgi:TonB family protein